MKNRRNYYRILQVQPDAPYEVIKASYHTLMRQLKKHPDLGGDHCNAQVINEAYATLQSPDRRKEYDKSLFESYTKKPFSEEGGKRSVITFFCPFCKRPMTRPATIGETCVTCHSPLPSSENKMASELGCRRAFRRTRKESSIRYYTAWPQKGKKAIMVDLTPRGMQFKCAEKLDQDTLIKITSDRFHAIAKVMHSPVSGKKKGLYFIGVQFVSLTCVQKSGVFYTVSA